MSNDENFEPGFEGLNISDPVELARIVGHLELTNTAWEFLNTAVRDGDLRAVWGLVHEELRTQLARQWVIDNQRDIRAGGFDETTAVTGLANELPSHPLWVHFERVHVRSLRRVLPDTDTWGIGANTRLVGPDLEAIYVHDTSRLPPDCVWRPGTISSHVYPLIFRRTDDRWLLAMLGNNELIDDI